METDGDGWLRVQERYGYFAPFVAPFRCVLHHLVRFVRFVSGDWIRFCSKTDGPHTVEVEGSSPLPPTHRKPSRNQNLDYLPMVGSTAQSFPKTR